MSLVLHKNLVAPELGPAGRLECRTIEWRGKKLAWGWFCLPDKGLSLPVSTNPERKIRLRKGNIQIGFDDFLDPYFPEARSNGYMLGEIHLLSNEILPNGDRNALEVSEEAAALTSCLREKYFKDLWSAAHKANELNNAHKAVDEYKKKCDEFLKLTEEGIGVGIESKKKELEKAYEKAIAGRQKLNNASTASVKGEFVKSVVDVIAGDNRGVIPDLVKPQTVGREAVIKPKNSVLSEKVKTTDVKLKNAIVKVLVTDGIEPMKALDLAQKINEELSAKE